MGSLFACRCLVASSGRFFIVYIVKMHNPCQRLRGYHNHSRNQIVSHSILYTKTKDY